METTPLLNDCQHLFKFWSPGFRSWTGASLPCLAFLKLFSASPTLPQTGLKPFLFHGTFKY